MYQRQLTGSTGVTTLYEKKLQYIYWLLQTNPIFLDFFGYESVANEVGAVIDKVVLLQMKELTSAKQSHIDEYFH